MIEAEAMLLGVFRKIPFKKGDIYTTLNEMKEENSPE